MALFFHIDFNILDLFYSYSIWLEAFAILPQLYMLNRNSQGNVKILRIYSKYIVHRLKISQSITF